MVSFHPKDRMYSTHGVIVDVDVDAGVRHAVRTRELDEVRARGHSRSGTLEAKFKVDSATLPHEMTYSDD